MPFGNLRIKRLVRALVQTVEDRYKAELVYRPHLSGRYNTCEERQLATLSWADGRGEKRLHGSIGDFRAAELGEGPMLTAVEKRPAGKDNSVASRKTKGAQFVRIAGAKPSSSIAPVLVATRPPSGTELLQTCGGRSSNEC